jgi:DNA polymerase III subunit gamma/tau
MRVLSRAWQMLFKGLAEVKEAGKPLAAAEMVLVRIAYAADLPTPDELIRSLGSDQGSAPAAPNGNGGASASPPSGPSARYDAPRGAPRAALAPAQLMTAQVPDFVPPQRAPQPTAAASTPAIAVRDFPALIALAVERRDIMMRTALERDVRLVRFEDGRLEIALEPSARKTLVNDLSRKLSEWTNRRWMVTVSAETGAPTLKAQNEAKQAELEQGVQADPLVKAVLARFPGAMIVGVRKGDEVAAAGTPAADPNIPSDEPPFDETAYGEHRGADDPDEL